MIKGLIYNENIKYITNENKNPEHKREVNECYYIILASICLSISTDEIKLTQDIFDNNKVEIIKYYKILKENNFISFSQFKYNYIYSIK